MDTIKPGAFVSDDLNARKGRVRLVHASGTVLVHWTNGTVTDTTAALLRVLRKGDRS